MAALYIHDFDAYIACYKRDEEGKQYGSCYQYYA